MSTLQTIRVGVIGAGAICRDRHLPALRQMADVKLATVCNRSPQSSRRAAEPFGFADVETDWRKLVQRDDIDAVLIGTWPYTHAEMSAAALDAGKHVFCQARMAATLQEARAMVDAAAAHPDLVNHVCPPPMRMPFEPYVKKLLAEGALGALRQLRIEALDDSCLGPLHWRQRVEFSGIQILAVGILAETAIALVGEFDTLSAITDTPIATKPDENGNPYTIRIPQQVTIHGRLANGCPFVEIHSGLHRGPKRMTLELTGSKATLTWDFLTSTLALDNKPLDVPADQQRPWRVEADFIDAVRGRGDSGFSNSFAEAYRYMIKMDALHRSAREGRLVRRNEYD